MIDVLLSGRLRGAPAHRKAANGSTFTTFRLAATDRHGERVLCNCVAFSPAVQGAVAALADGDSLAVSGEGALTTWQGRDGAAQMGLDVVAHGVLSAYHCGRKRDAVAAGAAGSDAKVGRHAR